MGILRTAIVLSGLTAFVPSPPEDIADMSANAASNDAGTGYIQVAMGTFTDVASFCQRQPTVCKTAGYVAYKLERKAKYGVRMIYEWANEAEPTSPTIAIKVDPIKTGSTKTAMAQPVGFVSQSTLHIEDLIPVWLGPKNAKNS